MKHPRYPMPDPRPRAAPALSAISLVLLGLLSGCAVFEGKRSPTYNVTLPRGGAAASDSATPDASALNPSDPANSSEAVTGERPPATRRLEPLPGEPKAMRASADLSLRFSNAKSLTVTVGNLPLRGLIHYVLGDQLKINYQISEGVTNLDTPVTLSIQNEVSPRELFTAVEALLRGYNIGIAARENIYYLIALDPTLAKQSAEIGVGRTPADVPNVTGIITQIIPLKYGIADSIERIVRGMVAGQLQTDFDRGALVVNASRDVILRVLDIVQVLDVPANRGQHISLITATYQPVDTLVADITKALQAEGVPVSPANAGTRGPLVLLPMSTAGFIAVFGAEEVFVRRTEYWAAQLDRPKPSIDKQFFVFYPRFSRASDLAESLQPLLGNFSSGGRAGNQSRDTRSALRGQSGNSANNTPDADSAPASASGNTPTSSGGTANRQSGFAPRASGVTSISGENVNVSVDDRSNTLLFFTDGALYQSLVPLLRRLDVEPKQVMLEAMIAEVTLSDEFAFGVEWALTKGSNFGLRTLGALGTGSIGGLTLNYLDAPTWNVIANALASNRLVNVLSNPRLTVRDGVTATINVGTDVPIVGSTTIDPLVGQRQTTTVEYRKTGLELSVLPTITSRGLVNLQIEQRISNTVDGGVQVQGSPSIFERSISTEVLAQSGQTIVLGGLISENKSNSVRSVPYISDLPLIGSLFRSISDTKQKTELVLFVQPRVIETSGMWENVRESVLRQFVLIQAQGVSGEAAVSSPENSK